MKAILRTIVDHWVALTLALVFFSAGLGFTLALAEQVAFQCQRSAIDAVDCTLTTTSLLQTNTQTFPRNYFQGAQVRQGVSREGDQMYRVQLLTDTTTLSLTKTMGYGDGSRERAAVEQINQFFQDDTQAVLAIMEDNRGGIVMVGSVMMAAGLMVTLFIFWD